MSDPVTLAALKEAASVAKELGVWQKVFAKLLGNRQLAAQQLRIALNEIRKTFESLRNTIMEISLLGVPGQNVADVQRVLNRIESGQLYEDVIQAKGSCGRICNIYHEHLKAWFTDALKPAQAAKLEVLFMRLCNSDGWAIGAAERLLEDAKPLARDIRKTLPPTGDPREARRLIAKFERRINPTLKEISARLVEMIALENEFIQQKRLT